MVLVSLRNNKIAISLDSVCYVVVIRFICSVIWRKVCRFEICELLGKYTSRGACVCSDFWMNVVTVRRRPC